MLRCLMAFAFFVLPLTAGAETIELQPGPQAVQTLLASGAVNPGDRVVLLPGDYGMVQITDIAAEPAITFSVAPGAEARADGILVARSSGVRIEGLTVREGSFSPSKAGPYTDAALVRVVQSHGVELADLDIAVADETDQWSEEDWVARKRAGVSLDGHDLTLASSVIRNVGHAVTTRARQVLIENNEISFFAGDGLRALGDDSVYRNNYIHTCVKVDDNHDDGIQAWTVGPDGTTGNGEIQNVVIENNIIENGNHPLRCKLQGIGLFDGFFVNWTITGNHVFVDHWHGITVMGARNVQITRNVVLDWRPRARPGPPWVSITPHKDGRASSGNGIHRNVTQKPTRNKEFRQPKPGVRLGWNQVVDDPIAYRQKVAREWP